MPWTAGEERLVRSLLNRRRVRAGKRRAGARAGTMQHRKRLALWEDTEPQDVLADIWWATCQEAACGGSRHLATWEGLLRPRRLGQVETREAPPQGIASPLSLPPPAPALPCFSTLCPRVAPIQTLMYPMLSDGVCSGGRQLGRPRRIRQDAGTLGGARRPGSRGTCERRSGIAR